MLVMTVWRWTIWTVTVFAGLMALAMVFVRPADAAPTPDTPPERHPLVSIAELTCEQPPARMMLAMRRDGRIMISFVDSDGCLRWRPWTPMVRAR